MQAKNFEFKTKNMFRQITLKSHFLAILLCQALREYQFNQKVVQTDQGYQSHQLSTDLDPSRRQEIPLKNGGSRLLQSPLEKKTHNF